MRLRSLHGTPPLGTCVPLTRPARVGIRYLVAKQTEAGAEQGKPNQKTPKKKKKKAKKAKAKAAAQGDGAGAGGGQDPAPGVGGTEAAPTATERAGASAPVIGGTGASAGDDGVDKGDARFACARRFPTRLWADAIEFFAADEGGGSDAAGAPLSASSSGTVVASDSTGTIV